MPLLELVIVFIAFIGIGFLGLFTYLKNPKSATNKFFFLFALTIGSYLLVNYVSLHSFANIPLLVWVRTIMMIAVLINICFFFLVSAFPGNKLQLRPLIFWGAIYFTCVLLPLTQTNLIYQNVIIRPNGIESVPGIGMPLFLLHTILLLGGGFVILMNKFRKSNGIEKIQIKLFLLGAVLMFSLTLTTNLIFILIFNTAAFVGLLPLYTLVFIGFVSYAIVKHKFLNISLFLARSIAYGLLVVIATTVYTVILFLVSRIFFRGEVTTIQAVVFALITLIVSFTFQPLKIIIEKVTDAVLFKGQYSSNKLILDLTTIMALTIHVNELTQKTLHLLLTTMRIDNGAFIIFTKDGYFAQHDGYDQEPAYDLQELMLLCELKRLIVLEDEPEGQIRQILETLNISVVLPLYEDGHKEGLLLLGDKKSGEMYAQQDIEVLKIFAPEMLVAIQNAKSYQEISHFNMTLKEEVDKATKELRDANTRLQQLDKLKDEFVSVASHELRTPMTAVKSYLWMALDGKDGNNPEKHKYYLQRAYSAVDRLMRLVSDMLNVSRIDSGRVTIELRVVDLQKMVQEVFDEVMPRIQELGLNLVMNQTAQLPQVVADSDKVKEVLFNLIGNAMKFTPKGGTISVSFTQKDNLIETKVIDTGTGIDPANISKLFQKFSMISDSYMANSSIQGTGLGLYICKSIIELHGGKIWAESEGQGKGTRFIFSLKVATQEDVQKYAQDPNAEKKPMFDIIHTGV